jgi:hypothetical protein
LDEASLAVDAMDRIDSTAAAAKLAVLTGTELGSQELDAIAARTHELRLFKLGLALKQPDAIVPADYPVENEADALRVLSYQLKQRALVEAKRAAPHASVLSLRIEPQGALGREAFARYGHESKLRQAVAAELAAAVNELAAVRSAEPEPLIMRFRVPPYVSQRRVDRLLTAIGREGYQPLLPEYAIVSCEYNKGAGGIWQGSGSTGWKYDFPPPPDEWRAPAAPSVVDAVAPGGELADLDETGATDADILQWQRGKRAARLARNPSVHALGSKRTPTGRTKSRASLEEIQQAVAEYAQVCVCACVHVRVIARARACARVRVRAPRVRACLAFPKTQLRPRVHVCGCARPANRGGVWAVCRAGRGRDIERVGCDQ